MVYCVSLLVFLHGFLIFQTEGVLDLSAESSDSSPGYRQSYYIFQMRPIQRLQGKPENTFDRKAADLQAMQASSVFGAASMIKPTANMVARLWFQPVPVIPRRNPPTLVPPFLGNTALRSPVLTLSTQSKILERNCETSEPGNLVTYFSTSARFSPKPRILTTVGLPPSGALHSTSLLTSSTTKELRGDM